MRGANRNRLTPPAPGGWETLSTPNVLHDPWLRVEAEAVRTPAGTVLDPWWVLNLPDWLVVVAITRDQEVVLVRQWRQGARGFILEIPGGIMDVEDIDPIAAGSRELLEETGFAAEAWRLVGALWPDPARNNNRCHVVLGIGCHAVAAPRLEPGETLETVVLPMADIRRILRDGDMESTLHATGLLRGLCAAGILEF
ncbi:NUDIX hydrolase [Rhodovarius sp.]|uniref:NUDIX hydrolase n=1 Tax=Rhodovarius sp. TaxID=2972673 RepID=UPI003340D27B